MPHSKIIDGITWEMSRDDRGPVWFANNNNCLPIFESRAGGSIQFGRYIVDRQRYRSFEAAARASLFNANLIK